MSLTAATKAKIARALTVVGAEYLQDDRWTMNGSEVPHEMILAAVMRTQHGIPNAWINTEEYLQTYRRSVPALLISPTGGIHVGAKQTMPVNLDTNNPPMPDPNSDYVAPIKWYRDSNDEAQFVLDLGKTCRMVYKTAKGIPDFGAALSASSEYRSLTERWYQSLVNVSTAMCEAWNSAVATDWQAKPYQQVREALEATGLPAVCLEIFTVSVEYIPGNDEDERADTWTGVKFLAGVGKAATYSDYLNALYAYWHTLPFQQIPQPPKIYSNTDGDKTFSLVDLNPYMVQHPRPMTRAWREWLSKFTADEQLVILAWIWAVFFAKNKGRQSLWIVDTDGYSGKSVFVNALVSVLGSALTAALNKDSLKNQFGYAKIWSKRLVTYPDCKNRLFPRSEAAHVIPGGDLVDVEGKGRASFSAKMDAKMLVCSNSFPSLDPHALHERSRWIVVKVEMNDTIRDRIAVKDAEGNFLKDAAGNDIKVGDANFGQALVDGIAELLENAYHAYKQLCPTDADIILPTSVSETMYNLEDAESTGLDGLVDRYFFTKPDQSTNPVDLRTAYMDITTRLTGYREYANDRAYGDFVEYIEKRHKVRKMRLLCVSEDGSTSRPRAFLGIKPNEIAISKLRDTLPSRPNPSDFKDTIKDAPGVPATTLSNYKAPHQPALTGGF